MAKVTPLLDHLNQLYESRKFTDIVIEVQGEKIKAHKCILAKNICLREMMTQETKFLQIKVVEAKTLKSFIKFLYIGKVSENEDLEKLMDVARIYQDRELKHFIVRKLSDGINMKTFLYTLRFSIRNDCVSLKHDVCHFVAKHFDEVRKIPEFEHFLGDKETVYLIFKSFNRLTLDPSMDEEEFVLYHFQISGSKVLYQPCKEVTIRDKTYKIDVTPVWNQSEQTLGFKFSETLLVYFEIVSYSAKYNDVRIPYSKSEEEWMGGFDTCHLRLEKFFNTGVNRDIYIKRNEIFTIRIVKRSYKKDRRFLEEVSKMSKKMYNGLIFESE